MDWLPGWNTVEGANWWSNFYFACSIAALLFLGGFEVIEHKYSVRKEELAQIEADNLKRLNDQETAKLNLKASEAEARAAEFQLEIERLKHQGKKNEDRIVSFTVDVEVDFSWPLDKKPLLFNSNDNGLGGEGLFEIFASNSQFILYCTNEYSYVPTGNNSARFRASLAPKVGEPPLGRQLETISQAKDLVTYLILKGYWTHSRGESVPADNYPITVNRISLKFHVNSRLASYEFKEPKVIFPGQMQNTVYGLLTIMSTVKDGIGSKLTK